jgi:ubiquinone/menaquinone biosynthesis C-methylase UbiE
MADVDNSIPIEAWNTVLFDKFTRFRWVLSNGLTSHSDSFLKCNPYPKGAHVLDIGCGFGDTTRQIAMMVGPDGEAIGVDCAPNFIAAAKREATEAAVRNASFFTTDVQTDDLGGPHDFAFSRFGTMFFNLPGLALRNIRRALKPGGQFSMIVWRKREDNPWVHEAEVLVKEIVPVVSHDETDQVHCGPGPFSMAGPDMVSDMMRSAGFSNITFERFDSDVCIGRDLDEAIDFAMALGPAGEIIRLAGDEGVRLRQPVVDALGKVLMSHKRDDGIWVGSSSWFVTATNPLH